MEIRSPLLHLALLESLKANKISDEIDLFLPFIAVMLSKISDEEVTPTLLQERFTELFGITPPISAIQVFMTRAKKRKLLHKENHSFFANNEQVEKWKNGYDDKKDDIEASLAILRNDFKDFAKDSFNKNLEDEECDILMTEFIEKNISSVTTKNRFEKSQLKEKIKNTDHVTASFISFIHKEKTSTLDHFARIVKGMVLANYLCYADKIGSKKRYSSITVYIDTPIIVGLFGFSGNQKKKSINEFISLLKKAGIELKIFDKTLDEAQMLLGAWRDDLRKKNYERFNSKTLELLQAQGYDAERLDTEIKLFKSRIEKEGITVVTGYKPNPKYQCDELALESAISTNFKKTKNLQHDTICISRIYNMREGKLINDLNQTMSIFITPNTGLVNHANEFFIEEIPKKYIPLVVSEQWMTAMFWLKSSDIFNSLPMDQIVASAYGLLYTDDRFWSSFINKLQLLESKGQISEEDFTFVRWDSDLLNLIHDVSVDVGEDFSEQDVFEIVEKVKSKLIKDKDTEISELKDTKNSEIRELVGEISSRDNEINSAKLGVKKFSSTIGVAVSSIFCLLLILCVFWGVYTSLPIDSLNNTLIQTYKKSSLAVIAIVITSLFSFIGTIFGWNVITVYKWIRDKVTTSLYSLMLGK